jgi:hypothetical protein
MQSFQLAMHILILNERPSRQNGLKIHLVVDFQVRLAIILSYSFNIFGQQVDKRPRAIIVLLFAIIWLLCDTLHLHLHLLEALSHMRRRSRCRELGVALVLTLDFPQLMRIIVHDNEVLELEVHESDPTCQRIPLDHQGESSTDVLESVIPLQELLKATIFFDLLKLYALQGRS